MCVKFDDVTQCYYRIAKVTTINSVRNKNVSSVIPLLGRCELYGDPHYISFQGVAFDFLEDCTYVLVEERSPLHHLTIAVDNYFCVPGLKGSCAKGIILKYQNSIATLNISPSLFAVQVGYITLNVFLINISVYL